MAARRIELLKEVETTITKMGSVCISVKTDVTNRAEVCMYLRCRKISVYEKYYFMNNFVNLSSL